MIANSTAQHLPNSEHSNCQAQRLAAAYRVIGCSREGVTGQGLAGKDYHWLGVGAKGFDGLPKRSNWPAAEGSALMGRDRLFVLYLLQ